MSFLSNVRKVTSILRSFFSESDMTEQYPETDLRVASTTSNLPLLGGKPKMGRSRSKRARRMTKAMKKKLARLSAKVNLVKFRKDQKVGYSRLCSRSGSEAIAQGPTITKDNSQVETPKRRRSCREVIALWASSASNSSTVFSQKLSLESVELVGGSLKRKSRDGSTARTALASVSLVYHYMFLMRLVELTRIFGNKPLHRYVTLVYSGYLTRPCNAIPFSLQADFAPIFPGIWKYRAHSASRVSRGLPIRIFALLQHKCTVWVTQELSYHEKLILAAEKAKKDVSPKEETAPNAAIGEVKPLATGALHVSSSDIEQVGAEVDLLAQVPRTETSTHEEMASSGSKQVAFSFRGRREALFRGHETLWKECTFKPLGMRA